MQVNQFIENLASELALPDLALNDENVARLIVGEELIIDLEYVPEQERIQVYSELGPPAAGEEPLRELLGANLYGRATGGMTLALDDEENEVVLCTAFDLETIDMPRCLAVLETYAKVASFWIERLAGIDADEEATSDDAPPEMPNTNMLRI